jgi:sec-independent protein translocase protein TatB
MFDFTSSKLLLLGIVALLVIGPKDLPALLRTIGKYIGIIKRQAADFRAQFDEAMRESELTQLKTDMEKLQQDAESTMRATEQSVEKELSAVGQSVDTSLDTGLGDAKPAADPIAHDADGLPVAPPREPVAAIAQADSLNGASHPEEAVAEAKSEAGRPIEKSGA